MRIPAKCWSVIMFVFVCVCLCLHAPYDYTRSMQLCVVFRPALTAQKCPERACNKKFRDSTTLRKHMLVHRPRSYVCSECGRVC